MGFIFRLEDYAPYRERVGEATVLDVTRRTDPARIEQVWGNLHAVVGACGSPWIAQIWTKDAGGVLTRGGDLLRSLQQGGTTLAAQITVTGLGGSRWEPLAPSEPFAGVAELSKLAGGPSHITWRYDPIIPTVHDMGRFRRLAGRARALGITRCVMNFLAPPGRYKRVDARLSSALPGWVEGLVGYGDAWQIAVAIEIVECASDLDISVGACAESAALVGRVPGLRPAACGDHDWFVALSGQDPGSAATFGSRPGCGCAAYFDVGLYGQRRRCHGCLYCYAG